MIGEVKGYERMNSGGKIKNIMRKKGEDRSKSINKTGEGEKLEEKGIGETIKEVK